MTTKRPKDRESCPRPATIPRRQGVGKGSPIFPPEMASWPVQRFGKRGRPLTHPRADWLADPHAFGLPTYVLEHRFHPTRQWRLDVAWPAQRVALEIDGASGSYGRHSRPGGMRKDHEKLNAATLLGWRVLRILRGEETRLTTVLLLVAALRAPSTEQPTEGAA